MTRVLALDIGTSSVRALVFDGDGTAVAGAEARTRYDASEGGGELDPEELVAASDAAVREARREAGGVDAIAVSCFWHSLLPVDPAGRPLLPVLTWRDVRAAADADRLRAELDEDAVHARTGCVLHPSYWPAKLRWLRRTHPDVFEAAGRFVSFSDYLAARLAGAGPTTSVSMASGTGLLDVVGGHWDEPLLAAVGVDPARLPTLSDEPVGADVPWFPALGDGACSNVGCGAVGPGRAALMIGTSAAVRIVVGREHAAVGRGLFLYRLDATRFVQGGALSDGGNLWAWLERTLEAIDERTLATAPPDAHGLTFLALLGGERAPGWNAHVRGAVTGLRFDTGPQEIAQAALEGVAFRLAEILDRMPTVREIVATGGALRSSPAWAQIVADVLERPLALSAVPEASARGAAVVLLERLGERPAPPPVDTTFTPRPERAAAYRAARERQRALYEFASRGH